MLLGRCTLATLVLLLLLAPLAVRAEGGDAAVVGEGRRVSIEYTVTLEDGTTALTNVAGEPLVFEQGSQQILPALEKALEGLEPGATKTVTLAPEKAYGPVDPDLFQTVPLENVPEEARKEGAQLSATDPEGNSRVLRVREIRENEVILDLNHPLAGKTLRFDVRVLKVE